MEKCAKLFCLAVGIASLLFAIATGIVMLAKGSMVNLWVILVICTFIFVVACITCAYIETKKSEKAPEKIDTAEILLDAYKKIFKVE